jgi:hypothetical protein
MDRFAEADQMRVAYQRQQAKGLMTLEELQIHLSELDERRTEAEGELAALLDSRRRLDELRAFSDLIEEYLRELPYLVHGRDKIIRDYTYTEEHEERERKASEEWRRLSKEGRVPNEGHLPIFTVSPEMFRERKPEEMEQLRSAQDRERAERYRGVYTSLGLTVIAHKDGTLELTWRAGKGVSEVCVSPRCKAPATTLSSSTRRKWLAEISPLSPAERATGTSASGRTGYWFLSPRRLRT